MTPELLNLTAGVPARISVPALGVPVDWLSTVEVSGLIDGNPPLDLGSRAVVSLTGADLLVTVDLTGQDTAALGRGGAFDLRLSDPGPEDARALLLARGDVRVQELTTQTGTVHTVTGIVPPAPAGPYVGVSFAGQTYAGGT